MKPLPLPLRLAAGLAVSAKERAKDLPRQLTGLPVTLASQVLQISMRVQQQVTELAIKGDEALSGLQPVEETPSWATFDEDLDRISRFDRVDEPFGRERDGRDEALLPAEDLALPTQRPRPSDNGIAASLVAEPEPLGTDPWAEEERALSECEEKEAAAEEAAAKNGSPAPTWLPNYEELSLPQVRARLRGFSLAQLAELLAYEEANANRPEFVGMLSRRIDTVRAKESGK